MSKPSLLFQLIIELLIGKMETEKYKIYLRLWPLVYFVAKDKDLDRWVLIYKIWKDGKYYGWVEI